MTTTTLQRAGVLGGGIMGTGIAEICARSGLDVVLVETDSQKVSTARQRIHQSLERLRQILARR